MSTSRIGDTRNATAAKAPLASPPIRSASTVARTTHSAKAKTAAQATGRQSPDTPYSTP